MREIFNEDYEYKELALQTNSIAWLKRVRGYDECYSDDMAVGGRMDSAGELDGRAVMIEVKPTINRSMIDHSSDRPGSLESKVAGGLRELYQKSESSLAEALDFWNRDRPPIVAFLARKYTAGASANLVAMLARRAEVWKFDWRLWHWNGEQVVEIAMFDQPSPPSPDVYGRLSIPNLIGRVKREPPRSMAELAELANKAGVGTLFDRFVAEGRRLGFSRLRTRANILLRGRLEKGGKLRTVLGAYPAASQSDRGLMVGCLREALGCQPEDLPGDRAPRRGHLNTNRYLTSPEEVDRLLGIFAEATNNRSR